MSRITLKLLAVLLVCTNHAFAASEFNLDFGQISSTPSTYGGASGQTGTWNNIDTLGGHALLDTTGSATGATLSINMADDFGSDANFPGPNSTLLEDMLYGHGSQPTATDWSLTFIGLPLTTYDVYFYAPAHAIPTGEVRINNVPLTSVQGSPTETALINGLNWNVHTTTTLAGGILRITGANSNQAQFVGYGGIAGLQLVERSSTPIDPPPPGC